MRRFLSILLILSACAFGSKEATAAELRELGLRDMIVHVLQSDPTIPPEWGGVWSITDSLFSCIGPLIEATTSLDTLCAGIGIDFNDMSGNTLDCTGTATATVVDVTCTGSGNLFEDCDYTETLEFDAVRSGGSFSGTLIVNFTTQGTGSGCGTSSCILSRFTATRVADEPAIYCATQTLTSSWGRVKAIYR